MTKILELCQFTDQYIYFTLLQSLNVFILLRSMIPWNCTLLLIMGNIEKNKNFLVTVTKEDTELNRAYMSMLLKL